MGWLTYRRVKTGKAFCRPMNRVVHAHLNSLRTENHLPNDPVFLGGSSRPNVKFRELCDLAEIAAKIDGDKGEHKPWVLKDLRKTCATHYDEHMPESSIEILGHAVGGVTYRHYAHRAPLAHKAINTLPQPSAFSAWLTLKECTEGPSRQSGCIRFEILRLSDDESGAVSSRLSTAQ